MADNWGSGLENSVKWTPQGGSEITLAMLDQDYTFKQMLAEITNSKTGGQEAYLATKKGQEGTATALMDLDALPANTAVAIKPGQKGLLKIYITSTIYHALPVVISDVKETNKVGDALKITFTWKGNYYSTGTLAYAVNP